LYSRLIFNYLGKGIPAIISFLVTPRIIEILGFENYGLISLFLTLTSIFLISDFGIGVKIIKILSTKSINLDHSSINSIFHTYEKLFLLISLGVFVVLYSFGEIYLKISNQDVHWAENYLFILPFAISLQILPVFYQSVLQGLDKQVVLNIVLILMSFLRNLGGLFCLLVLEKNLIVYFEWILFSSIISIVVLSFVSRRYANVNRLSTEFNSSLFKIDRNFSLFIFLNSIIGVIVGQLDKFLILRYYSLEILGKYQVGLLFSSIIWMIILPFSNATFPHFSRIVHSGNNREIRTTLHSYSQYFSTLIYPVVMTFIVFADIIVSKYLVGQSEQEVSIIANLTVCLVLGTLVNGICSIPGNFLLSKGLSKLLFASNLIQLVLIYPLMTFFIDNFGLLGAGITWLILNSVYILFMIPIFLLKYMNGCLWNWIFKDNFAAALFSFFLVYVSFLFYQDLGRELNVFVFMGVILGINVMLLAFIQPYTRIKLFSVLKYKK
jgi:O-antigen/teichoic acid export membrane protein